MKKTTEATSKKDSQGQATVAFAMSAQDKAKIERYADKADRTFAAQCRRMLRFLLSDEKMCASI